MKAAALVGLICAALVAVSSPSSAHHSFASWDLQKDVPFEGIIDTVNFRNPHMSMTLLVTKPNGEQQKIDFAEGAPANMLIRMGLKPDMIKPGTKIKAIGAPRKDNPNVYFLKTIILEDGTTFAALGGPRGGKPPAAGAGTPKPKTE